MADDQKFAEWCVAELLGHRREAGFAQEVQVAGAGFLRLDIPESPGVPARTQFINPSSVYALHPVGEAEARAMAARLRTEPVQRWELPALESGPLDDEDVSCGCLPSEEISTYGPF